jgi:hypothetical protein
MNFRSAKYSVVAYFEIKLERSTQKMTAAYPIADFRLRLNTEIVPVHLSSDKSHSSRQLRELGPYQETGR